MQGFALDSPQQSSTHAAVKHGLAVELEVKARACQRARLKYRYQASSVVLRRQRDGKTFTWIVRFTLTDGNLGNGF